MSIAMPLRCLERQKKMATDWVAILMRSMLVSDFQEKELTMAIRNISSFASDSASVGLI
jgi:hypothetical protein